MLEILRNILELSVVQHPVVTFFVMLFFRVFVITRLPYFIAIINFIILAIAIIIIFKSPEIFRNIFLYIKGSGPSFLAADVFKESMDWGAGFVSGVLYMIFLVCLGLLVFGRFWGQDQDKD